MFLRVFFKGRRCKIPPPLKVNGNLLMVYGLNVDRNQRFKISTGLQWGLWFWFLTLDIYLFCASVPTRVSDSFPLIGFIIDDMRGLSRRETSIDLRTLTGQFSQVSGRPSHAAVFLLTLWILRRMRVSMWNSISDVKNSGKTFMQLANRTRN